MGETKLLTFDEVRSFLSDCERKITRNRSIFQDESYMREISRLEGDRDSYKQRSETAEAQIESLKRGVVPADWVCFEPTGNKRIRFVPDCLILDRLGIVRVTDFPDSEDPVIYRRVEATEASGNQSANLSDRVDELLTELSDTKLALMSFAAKWIRRRNADTSCTPKELVSFIDRSFDYERPYKQLTAANATLQAQLDAVMRTCETIHAEATRNLSTGEPLVWNKAAQAALKIVQLIRDSVKDAEQTAVPNDTETEDAETAWDLSIPKNACLRSQLAESQREVERLKAQLNSYFLIACPNCNIVMKTRYNIVEPTAAPEGESGKTRDFAKAIRKKLSDDPALAADVMACDWRIVHQQIDDDEDGRPQHTCSLMCDGIATKEQAESALRSILAMQAIEKHGIKCSKHLNGMWSAWLRLFTDERDAYGPTATDAVLSLAAQMEVK